MRKLRVFDVFLMGIFLWLVIALTFRSCTAIIDALMN